MSAFGMNSAIVLALAFIVCSLNHQVEAIQCYYCNSHYNESCADDSALEQFKTDCKNVPINPDLNKTYTMCRKIKLLIDYNIKTMNKTERIIRQCGWDDSAYKGVCYQRTGTGEKQVVCSCYDNYCNTASTQTPLTAAAYLLATMLTVSYYKLS